MQVKILFWFFTIDRELLVNENYETATFIIVHKKDYKRPLSIIVHKKDYKRPLSMISDGKRNWYMW